jgi:hypothetical protein
MFAKELARRLKSRNINNIIVNALHPGVVVIKLCSFVTDVEA